MESENKVLSKFKGNLDVIIDDYKNKIVEIEKEEEFIQILGDLVNYSKSDFMLLPFYDMTILTRVFERVFPLSKVEINKIKSAKYLIEASNDIDKNNFLQYNNAVDDLEKINEKLTKYYENLLNNNSIITEKEECNSIIEKYSLIYDTIGEACFIKLLDNIDLFKEVIYLCSLNNNEINLILDIAIKSNLEILNKDGVINTDVDEDILLMKENNNKVQDAINDLSNLLDASI